MSGISGNEVIILSSGYNCKVTPFPSTGKLWRHYKPRIWTEEKLSIVSFPSLEQRHTMEILGRLKGMIHVFSVWFELVIFFKEE